MEQKAIKLRYLTVEIKKISIFTRGFKIYLLLIELTFYIQPSMIYDIRCLYLQIIIKIYTWMAASSWQCLVSIFNCCVSALLRLMNIILLPVGFCCLAIKSKWFLNFSHSFLNTDVLSVAKESKMFNFEYAKGAEFLFWI